MSDEDLIIDPSAGDNGDEEKQPEAPPVCAQCFFFSPALNIQNPKITYSVGPCMNKDHDEAHFGVMMSGFGGCNGWK